jgi:hypothetical protein
LKDTWEDIRNVKAIGVDRKEMFLFGSTRKVRIPKRMLGEVKNVKKDVNNVKNVKDIKLSKKLVSHYAKTWHS